MSVYYNDSEPFVCDWLENLMGAGLIPQGVVDRRPIQEVMPNDVRDFTQCHFFAGIGGWAYALQLAGWGDRPVWTGSCPCQPFSAAGKAHGADDSRHLWPSWRRLIAECQPHTVFGEQVASIDGRAWLDLVHTDLEALEYAVGAAVICAASQGAPHARHRIWFAATLSDPDGGGWKGEREEAARAWSEQQFAGLVQDQLQLSVPSGRLRALVDGVSSRTPKLRAYGNAIVPQVAAAFVSAYLECAASVPAPRRDP